ncbi:MAG: Ig-like domain-containing protein, partial [bacterium]|nr:Ig-like domain-containing protein [bacterium]
GWPLADSLQVYIKDNYNNPVGGYPVTFRSTEGDNPGTFNGYTAQQIIVKTDSKGIARVMFYSGAKPGVTSLAKAIAEGLTGSPITFTVTVAELAEIKYVDGDLQTGAVGSVLPKPLTAKVVDTAGKAIPKFDITFKVVKGDGNLSGNSTITVKSDTTAKTAAATFTLGTAPGDTNNVVEASAIYKSKALKGSPIRYRASAAIGSVSELKEVSGNYQREVVGNPLENPLVVRITDSFGNPFAGHPVTFTVKTGGGYLDGSSSKKTVTKNSSDSGKVQVLLTVGTTAGQNNNSVEIVSYKPGTQTHLKNSPMTYFASATASAAHSLATVSGENQPRSAVRTALAQPFVVKVKDKEGNPVPDHPVQWKVVQGGGTFDGLTDSIKTVNSNQNGLSQVYYYPGPLAGLQNVVRSQSYNQVELTGSPRTFVVDTKEGAISASRSDVSATSPIAADGVTQSKITVTLMDDWGNKIAGKALTLSPPPTGSNNTYTSFSELTNANGQAYAYLASTRAEQKIIKVKEFSGVQLLDTAQVKFTALDAQGISYVSGTDQTGNFGTATKDKIKARVYDKNGNPISDYPVFFEAYEGGGYVWECRDSKPVFTDQTGVASASWILGPSVEVNRARANAAGLAGSGSVRYIATAHSGTAKKIEKGSGDTQTGTAGLPLNNPLVVKVVDSAGDPIYNYPVKFKVTFGGGNFNDASIVTINTNPFGEASRYLTLGRIAGANVTSVEATDLAGSPIGFTSQGIPGAAAKIVVGAGEGKTGPVGGQISGIQVKVTDIYDNAVGGYTVNFAVNKGNASIIGSGAVVSGPNGIASISINVGNAVGEIEILAAAPGLIGDGLKIKVYAVAATAVSMTISNGNNQQGTIERELVYPLSVAVLDQYGNPAGGQNIPISFVVTQGNGILLNGPTVYADEKGIASARFQLGNVTGSNYKVWAINNGLTGSPLEFKANGVTNKFPLITPIPPVTIRENQNITFTVNATDDNNDPIKFGARSLPQGALFDSLGTKQFSWTPNYFQAGVHEVRFIATDNKSGFDDEVVRITVENVNRMPQISYYEPIAHDLVGHKNIGESFRFVVQVNDPDNDEITYKWFDNDVLVSSKNYYDFYVANEEIGSHYIVVKASDGYDTVQRDWAIYIKTPVELAHFSGRIVERQGIELEWETTVETAHAGFNIFRRSASEKEYEQINGNLIKADGTKKYRYIDRSVTVGETYFFKLEDVSLTGEKTQHDAITLFVTKPDEYRLYQNYPNPFNPKTHIDYQLPEPSRVTIRIFNIIGQEVRTLVDEMKTVGYHSVMWNGLDNFGTPATSGIYYYRMETNSFIEVKKMVLLR